MKPSYDQSTIDHHDAADDAEAKSYNMAMIVPSWPVSLETLTLRFCFKKGGKKSSRRTRRRKEKKRLASLSQIESFTSEALTVRFSTCSRSSIKAPGALSFSSTSNHQAYLPHLPPPAGLLRLVGSGAVQPESHYRAHKTVTRNASRHTDKNTDLKLRNQLIVRYMA